MWRPLRRPVEVGHVRSHDRPFWTPPEARTQGFVIRIKRRHEGGGTVEFSGNCAAGLDFWIHWDGLPRPVVSTLVETIGDFYADGFVLVDVEVTPADAALLSEHVTNGGEAA